MRRPVWPAIQLDMASVTHSTAVAASLRISKCRNPSTFIEGFDCGRVGFMHDEFTGTT